MTQRLGLDPATVAEARKLASEAGQPITELARTHTTVSVERAVLRLAGLDGADDEGMPWVNRLADAVRGSAGLEHGIALPVWDALVTGDYPDLAALARDAAVGRVSFRVPGGAAALGAEGLAADVTMLIGNGYVPGHADLALGLVRDHPGVRSLFQSRIGGETEGGTT